jgi:hypothetical protein
MAQAQGMAHFSSMMPSQDKRHMAQELKSAIASALQRMAQYNALGMDTSAMSCRITALEKKLNGQMDSMFKLQFNHGWRWRWRWDGDTMALAYNLIIINYYISILYYSLFIYSCKYSSLHSDN